MHELMQNKSATMNHLEIAELVNSRDDDVKRSIDRLAGRGVIALPPLAEVVSTSNNRSYTKKTYTFSGEKGKRDSIIVVAQLSPEFTARLVDRWAELERQAQQPQIPQSYAEALQLAADQAKQLELAAPKISAYDKLIDSTHLKTVGEVAKSIGLSSAQKLNNKLDTVDAYDKRCAGCVWAGWFIEQGLGKMITTKDGYSSNKVTGKGQAWALDLFGGAE